MFMDLADWRAVAERKAALNAQVSTDEFDLNFKANAEIQELLQMIDTVENQYPYLLHLDPAA